MSPTACSSPPPTRWPDRSTGVRRARPVLPLPDALRATSAAVAGAVGRAAAHDGVARTEVDDGFGKLVRDAMWQPVYPEIKAIRDAGGS